MHRLIYTSTATRLLETGELDKLLNAARRNNAAARITGMLVYHEGCFLQVLEGEKEAVERCYRFIKGDGRHRDCIELANEAAPSRLFSEWWMAYQKFVTLGPSQKKQFIELKTLANRADKMPIVDNPKANTILLAFLSTFRDLEMVG